VRNEKNDKLVIKKIKKVKIMKLYIIKQTSKDGKEYKRASLRMTNDLTGEEVFLSGFLKEFDEEKK
jgi:hypothetical protein